MNAMLRLPRRMLAVAASFAMAVVPVLAAQAPGPEPRIEAIRFWSFGDVTRVAIETHGEYHITAGDLDHPARLFFDLRGVLPPASLAKGTQTLHVDDRLVRQIRVAETEPGVTRIVFDLEAPVDYSSSQLVSPDRLMIELRPKTTPLAGPSIARSRSGIARFDENSLARSATSALPFVEPADLFAVAGPAPDLGPDAQRSQAPASTALSSAIEIRPPALKPPPVRVLREHRSAPSSSGRVVADTSEAGGEMAPAKIEDGNRSLVRVFGLKIHTVVIDAGHGGHDTGTIGPGGLMEKDLVLDVALRLGKLIERRLGANVIYTRSTDTFIPLDERTKIANDAKADLFISVHANSSPEASATGVETYFFNFTSDKSGLDVATRENATSTSSISELNDLLHAAVLNAKVEESREFAQKVETSLYAVSVKMNRRSHDRGVKKAPFVVLIGATMPSILAEIGFVSNPHDERLLKREVEREQIAEALYKGVAAYDNSLSHVEMARSHNR